MSQKFMICDLHLEGSAIPSIIQVNIVGMDESQFFVYTAWDYKYVEWISITY